MRGFLTHLILGIALLCVCFAHPDSVAAVQITIDQPGDREFVRDIADMLTPGDEQKIQAIADTLLTERATPIIVITIDSMAKHGGAGMRIETFATLLFDQWGIGVKEINGKQWNTGILLLVSRDDRQARIELGAGWAQEKDDLAAQIMNEQIISRFKQGNFSGGIAAGVESLDAMAREKPLPKMVRPWWHYGLIVGLIALATFTFVSLIRNGSSGWAWLMWGAIFAVLGIILYNMLRDSGRGGGGYSGGSFGGGFSGGGGASGSW